MAKILIDCDDTIMDLCAKWIDTLNNMYGTTYTKYDIPDWDMTGMFPGVPKEELLKPLHTPEFWEDGIYPIEGSQEYIKKLQYDGHEIYIVTATDYRNFGTKVEKLIHKYFDFIPTKNIILAYNKQMIQGDVLIDDFVNNLIGGSYKGILFSACHNSEALAKENNLLFAGSWKDCYETVNVLF